MRDREACKQHGNGVRRAGAHVEPSWLITWSACGAGNGVLCDDRCAQKLSKSGTGQSQRHSRHTVNDVLEDELEALIRDAFRTFVVESRQLGRRFPSGAAEVKQVLIEACIQRLHELEELNAPTETPALYNGLKDFIREQRDDTPAVEVLPCPLQTRQRRIKIPRKAVSKPRTSSRPAVKREQREQLDWLRSMQRFHQFLLDPDREDQPDVPDNEASELGASCRTSFDLSAAMLTTCDPRIVALQAPKGACARAAKYGLGALSLAERQEMFEETRSTLFGEQHRKQ